MIKPCTFLLIAHVHPFGHPVGVDLAHFQLIAPYESDPTKWLTLPWIDRYSGQRVTVTTGDAADAPDAARVQTYRNMVRAFHTHPEAKSVGPDVKPCGRGTVGLLQRRVVREAAVMHVGKEANKLEEVEARLEQDPEVIYTEYQDPKQDPWRTQVLHVLRQMPAAELA